MTGRAKRKELPAPTVPLAGSVEFDLGKLGIIRVTHRGDHVRVRCVSAPMILRGVADNTFDVSTEGQP